MQLPFDSAQILKTALKKGGEFADLYFEDIRSLQMISENRQLEKIQTSEDRGIGLRVLSEAHTYYAYTNDLSLPSLMDLAEQLAAAVGGQKKDIVFSLRTRIPHISLLPKTSPDSLNLTQKSELIRRAEVKGWNLDPRVKQVKILYSDIHKKIQIFNSLGEHIAEDRDYTLFFVQTVVEENGQMQTGYVPVGGVIGLEVLDQDPPEKIAEESVQQALLTLKAQPAPTGHMPVILSSSAGGTMIHEAVGHGLEADLASPGFSVYHNKLGQKIAQPTISVVDDATLPQKRGSFVFDDEGTPSERTLLIDKGILKNYLYDRRMAFRDGAVSTGNGRRESYRYRPLCRMTNTMILPGTDDPDSILQNTENGLFVKKMGGGQVNTVNGEFVFEVSEAFLIEKGKLGTPVKGALLLGNGPEVLNTIDKVGSDHGFGLGTCGKEGQGVPVADAQPTIRIPNLLIGSKG